MKPGFLIDGTNFAGPEWRFRTIPARFDPPGVRAV